MKIRSSQKSGSILMVTILTIVIIGIALGAYLDLVAAQHKSVFRSQNWNAAIPSSEAGIEEAMTHLNWLGNDTNRAQNGWTLVNGLYHMSRTNDNGSWRYEVDITPYDPPVISCTGFIKVPIDNTEVSRRVYVNTAKASTGMKGLVAKGNITLGPGSVVNSFDSRITPVYSDATARTNAFVGSVNGNIANGTILGSADTGPGGTVSSTVTGSIKHDLNVAFPDMTQPFTGGYYTPSSGTVSVTNYVGSTITVSTNVYPNPVPASGVTTTFTLRTNAIVTPVGVPYSSYLINTNVSAGGWPGAGYSGTITTNTLSITGATILPTPGSYKTPPGVTTVNTTNIVKVKGKDTAVVSSTYNYSQISGYTFSVTNYVSTNYTYTYYITQTNSGITTTTYTYLLDSLNYKTDSISMSGHDEMYVRGNAVLWITGSLSQSGQAQITVAPGASLALYIGDTNGSPASISITGNGIVNQAGDTTKLSIYGLPTATSITLAGNAGYVGTVYAPEATLNGHGSGNTTDDFQGAAIVNLVGYNGHFNFHYDEKLGDNGGVTQWNVASWQEY